MTIYEIDIAILEQRRAALVAEARHALRRPGGAPLRGRLAAGLRMLAEALEPAPAVHPRTVA